MTAGWLRSIAAALGVPTHLLLLAAAALAVFDFGVLLGERARGIAELERRADPAQIMALARRRIDRADLLARIGPMLGLMGTLIPLGPGLAALGRGDVAELAAAVTVAFDTTVVGLAIGVVAFVAGRARRRMYDGLLDRMEP